MPETEPCSTSVSNAHVRVARAADVPELVRLVSDVLCEYGLVFGAGSETDEQLADLPTSYEKQGGAFWVATRDGSLVGTCGVFPVGDGVLELRKMYLSPSARGLGLGQRLLDVALGFARAANARAVVLDTTEQMLRAISFYERNGFVRDDAQVRGTRCSRGYRLDL